MISLKNYDYPIEKFIAQAEKTRLTMPHNPAAVRRRIYNMSTEITPSFMEGINFEDTRVLTVGSSGDQLLTYALKGSKDITIMDANSLTPFYSCLKLEALNKLSREEFISFFTKSSSNKNFMDEKTYKEKIRPNLDSALASFWDNLYEKDYHDKIFNLEGSLDTLPPYLINDENYSKTKDVISNVNVTFVLSDISNFYKYAEGEYDFIDLSNIYTYVSKDKFFGAVDNLYPNLKEKGLFKLHYGDLSLKEDFDLYGKECKIINSKETNAKVFFVWQNSPEIKSEKT